MGILCFIYLICSLRTNFCFFMIFLTLVIAFCLLAGAYWELNKGNAALAHRLQVAAGAFTFVTSLFGWWIFLAIMLASLDFPFEVPGRLTLFFLSFFLLFFVGWRFPRAWWWAERGARKEGTGSG